MKGFFVRSAATMALLQALAGCTCSTPTSEKTQPVPSATAAASVVPAASGAPVRPTDLGDNLRVPTAWPIPVGPKLEILPGEGLGPIRFGATVATIERLMEAPCEVKTEASCLYIGRAAEFILKDGAASEIRAYRQDRPATPGNVYGIFNGRLRNGVTFLMKESGVRELMGPPLKQDTVPGGGPNDTVSVATYPGIRIEYDRIPNGNIVVGGVVITPTKK
jgi:hypothetical protein